MAFPLSRTSVSRPVALANNRLPVNLLAVLALLVLTALAIWAGPSLRGGVPRGDSFLQYIPWYSFLGDQLTAGNIPGWNVYQFSGAPFAGDPQSGWMYLPVMVIFAVLPPVAAYTVYAGFHVALAGIATFALGRVLGFGVLAALVSGIAYQFSPFVEGPSCCSIRTHVASWLPVALLGIELALRRRSWLGRAGWWSLTGLAISQMLGGWLGQGAYYGLLAIGAYVLFRTMVAPPRTIRSFQARVTALVVHGAAILVIGFGLAAAGVLPRIDAVSRTNVAGGEYQGSAAESAATARWEPLHALDRVLSTTAEEVPSWYLGGAVFALAVIAPLLARRRPLVVFFAVFSCGVFLLPLDPTPLHDVLNLLPRFEVLHQHVPSRSLVILFLGPALMAGATVDAISRWRRSVPIPFSIVLLPPLLFMTAAYILVEHQWEVGRVTFIGVFGVTLLLAAAAASTLPSLRRGSAAQLTTGVVVPVLLALVVFWDPTGFRLLNVVREDGLSIPRTPDNLRELSCLGEPSAAAEFLQEQQATGPWRYFGNDFAHLGFHDGEWESYRHNLKDPDVQRLLVVTQSVCLGLYDIQGYNPVQSARYTEYMAAMNGRGQEYHAANVLQGGVSSPLLDALNARYIVVPAEVPPGRADLMHLAQRFPTVYEDSRVRILENPEALPRAWIVHAAVQVPPGEALAAMTGRGIDLSQVAVLETEPPELSAPNNPATDEVTVQTYGDDQMELTARTEAPGMVVLSEVYDPGWQAYLDGESVPLVVADHALRAVAVPAGEHTIELRYESRPLRIGLWITTVTALAVIAIALASIVRTIRRNRH